MPRKFKKLTHTIYECKYHFVFCPKYRYRIFKDELAEYTKQQNYQNRLLHTLFLQLLVFSIVEHSEAEEVSPNRGGIAIKTGLD